MKIPTSQVFFQDDTWDLVGGFNPKKQIINNGQLPRFWGVNILIICFFGFKPPTFFAIIYIVGYWYYWSLMKVDMKHWNFLCHPLGVKWPSEYLCLVNTNERPEHISNNVHNMYLYNYTRILLTHTHTHILSAYRIHIYISLNIKYVYYISNEIHMNRSIQTFFLLVSTCYIFPSMASFSRTVKLSRFDHQVAVSRQALGDTNAGAIELTHNPLINGARTSRFSRIRIDEVTSPPQRQGFTTQIQTFHQSGNGILQEIFWKLFKLWSIRCIEGIDGTSTTDCRNTTCLWFLVNDSRAGITNHIHTNLAFYDAWAETLIHQLTSGGLTAWRWKVVVCLLLGWLNGWMMDDGKMDFNSESVGILTNLSGSMTLCHQKL